MHRLFTVRWPLLARLEAFLLFVAILAIWNKNPVLHSVLDDFSAVEADRLGMSKSLLNWGVLVFLTVGPYLGAMMAVDRVLPVRNGLAVLSLFAIAIWAGLGAIFAPDVAGLLPFAWVGGRTPMSFTREAVIAAASIGLLIHARPLSLGLVDRGASTQGSAAQSGAHAGARGPEGAVRADPVPTPWGAPEPRSAADRVRSEGAGGILLAGLIGAFAVVMLGWRYEFERPASIAGMKEEKVALPRVSAPATSRDASEGLDVCAAAGFLAACLDAGRRSRRRAEAGWFLQRRGNGEQPADVDVVRYRSVMGDPAGGGCGAAGYRRRRAPVLDPVQDCERHRLDGAGHDRYHEHWPDRAAQRSRSGRQTGDIAGKSAGAIVSGAPARLQRGKRSRDLPRQLSFSGMIPSPGSCGLWCDGHE
jgi:hypothetical protein